jgi:LPS export ABC transporter protein LptC
MRKHIGSFRYLVSLTPIFLMSSLSLLSIVLVKQSVIASRSDVAKTIKHEHNYYLNQFFTSQFTTTGELSAYFGGNSALHFESALQLSVQNLSFYYVNKQNQYQGRSNSALIDDGGDIVKLFNQAEIVRYQLQPIISTTILRSNYLQLTQNPDTLSSDQYVKIYKDRSTITAESLNYSNLRQQLNFTGKVKIEIQSKH